MLQIQIQLIPILADNYVAVVYDPISCRAVVIDPGEGHKVESFLRKNELQLDLILITHHHQDHIGGVDDLMKSFTNCRVIRPKDIHEGDIIRWPHGVDSSLEFLVLEVPGHTLDHVAYEIPGHALFCGDTLFSLGCGRLFEGTAEQMWASLTKILKRPDETMIYAAHEYTLSNGRFALSIDPNNIKLIERIEEVKRLREHNLPTLPIALSKEKLTNPFLRAGSADEFKRLRKMKDNF